MKYRKLRIAWSVLCGVVVVSMVALWIRSYSWNDHLDIRTGAPSGPQRSNVVLLSNWGFLQALFNQTIDINNGIEYRNQPAWARTDVGFEWRHDGAIKVPDSFVVVMAAIAGVTPWLNRRFTVRTLLIAMTCIAVAIVLVAYTIRNPPPGP
jgi:hypothetical protein